MITASCRFAHSFKIMRIPQPTIPVRAPSQPVTVLWYDSADVIEVTYIRCLHGRVTDAFEVWALAEDGVHEVHPYARVKLLSEFMKDTFHTHFFNAQRFQIPFLGRRALNMSVEFIDVVRVTHHVGSRVDYTQTFLFTPGVSILLIRPPLMFIPSLGLLMILFVLFVDSSFDPITSVSD